MLYNVPGEKSDLIVCFSKYGPSEGLLRIRAITSVLSGFNDTYYNILFLYIVITNVNCHTKFHNGIDEKHIIIVLFDVQKEPHEWLENPIDN